MPEFRATFDRETLAALRLAAARMRELEDLVAAGTATPEDVASLARLTSRVVRLLGRVVFRDIHPEGA